MESITLGQVASAIGTLSVIFGAIIGIFKVVKKAEKDREDLRNAIEDFKSEVRADINALKEDNKSSKMEDCKDYLVDFLNDIEAGNPINEERTKRAYERYDYYVGHGGNSYIKHKWIDFMEKER